MRALHWIAGLVFVLVASPAVAGERLSLAVAPFSNRTADPANDALGKGLADMLITDLSVSDDLVLVERARLQALLDELKLSRTDLIDPATAVKTGKLIAADLVLTGAINIGDGDLRLDAHLVDVETGEVAVTASATGPMERLFAVEALLVKRLLEQLGAKLSPLQHIRIRKSPTKSVPALRRYSDALDATDRGDREAARRALSKALEADPSFARARKLLEALSDRVERLERAGGLVLKPATAIDYWTNYRIHAERGADDEAFGALDAALALRPDALDVLGEATRHGRPTAAVRDVDALALAAVQALRARDPRAAGATTTALRKAAPDDVRGLLLRAEALSPPLQTAPTALERAEQVEILDRLAAPASRSALRGRFLGEPGRERARRALDALRDHLAVRVPGLEISRRVLAHRPVAAAIFRAPGPRAPLHPSNYGYGPLHHTWLQVRIAEPGVSEAFATLASGKEVRLAPRETVDGEATVLSVRYLGVDYRPGVRRLAVRWVDRRRQPATAEIPVHHPHALNHTRRDDRQVPSFGMPIRGRWPPVGVGLVPWGRGLPAADPTAGDLGSWLADPLADVWSRPIRSPHASMVIMLQDGFLGVFAQGRPTGRSGLRYAIAYRLADGALGLAGTVQAQRESAKPFAFTTTSESIAGELGLSGPRLLPHRADHLLPLLAGSARAAAIDLYADLELAPVSGGHHGLFLAAARGLDHRFAALRGVTPGPGTPFSRDVIAFGMGEIDATELLARATRADRTGPSEEQAAARILATAAVLLADPAAPMPPGGIERRLRPGRWPDSLVIAALHRRARAADPVVKIGSFWLDRFEVSIDRWRRCERAGACSLSAWTCAASPQMIYDSRGKVDLWPGQTAACLPIEPNPYPLTLVQRDRARAFCRWSGGDLPTAAQWAQAVSGFESEEGANLLDGVGCRLRPGWGPLADGRCQSMDPDRFDGYLWIAPGGVHPAARSGSGVENLAGNVREWLSDGDHRVAGCGFHDPAPEGGCAARVQSLPTWAARDVGFRCAYPRRPEPKVARAPALTTSLDRTRWARIPGGTLVTGRSRVAALPLDSRRWKSVAPTLPRVSAKALSRFLGKLRKIGAQELRIAHIEEILARGAWLGLSSSESLDRFLDILTAERPDSQSFRLGSIGNDAPTTRFRESLKWLDRTAVPRRLKAIEQHRPYSGSSCLERPRASPCRDSIALGSGWTFVAHLAAARHEISGFQLMRTEVTQAMFQRVMGSNPSFHVGCPTCPVEQVTWSQAVEFCRRVRARLPTELEWEYAAREGGEAVRYGPVDEIAWYGTERSHPVGRKRANAFGLRDMLGNVWEWAADSASDPPGRSADPRAHRALRGGSFASDHRVVDGVARATQYPAAIAPFVGFRCAR